jgi:hypothetical protein
MNKVNFDPSKIEAIPVFVVISNTDRTEGRGAPVYIGSTTSEVTAKRLAKGQGVMGSDANIQKDVAIRHKNNIYCRACIIYPTDKELEEQKKLEEVDAFLEKLRKLGVTEEDIKFIKKLK